MSRKLHKITWPHFIIEGMEMLGENQWAKRLRSKAQVSKADIKMVYSLIKCGISRSRKGGNK